MLQEFGGGTILNELYSYPDTLNSATNSTVCYIQGTDTYNNSDCTCKLDTCKFSVPLLCEAIATQL